MSGFGSGDIKAQFVPDQTDEAGRPRFWEGSDGGGPSGKAQPDPNVRQSIPGRWPEVDLGMLPPGQRPGERAGSGGAGRLMSTADAAQGFQRRNRTAPDPGKGPETSSSAGDPSEDSV